MTTEQAMEPLSHGSFGLVWTLVTRSVGLATGVAIAMLLFAAMISR